MTEEIVAREYEEKLAKVEHLAGKFRRVLATPSPVVFIRRGNDSRDALNLLASLLAERAANPGFLLLSVRSAPLDASGLHPRLRLHAMPYAGRWEGDDALWRHLFEELVKSRRHEDAA